MVGATATATEMQNNFGRYLSIVIGGAEVIVTKNGKEVGRFVPKDTDISYLTDSLTGILTRATDLSRRNLSHEQIFYLAHGITLFSGLINTRFLLSGKRRTLYKTCFVKRSL